MSLNVGTRHLRTLLRRRAGACRGCPLPARGVTRALLVLAAVLVLATLVAPAPAAAKDVSISNITIDAQVRPNGDVAISDRRTLDFSGSFHYVYWDLSTKGADSIEVLDAEGPSTADPATKVPYQPAQGTLGGAGGKYQSYTVADRGSRVRVQLNFEVVDAEATFVIRYVAKGAAKRYADTAELYWQFVGDDTTIAADDVRVSIRLPEGVTRDQVRAWAHGPLWGSVAITPQAGVTLEVDSLPASTFVEARVLFPAAALEAAPLQSGDRLAVVLAEEQRWADEANRARLVARVKVVVAGLVGLGVPLLALVLVGVLYLRYGREPRPEFQAQYLRDLPQPHLPPALAGFIWRMGSAGREDVTATLLDLVNRKVIGLERVVVDKRRLLGSKETTTYKLSLLPGKREGLLPYEEQLCRFLFHKVAGGDELVLSELKSLAAADRKGFAKGYQDWKKQVLAEGQSRGFLDPDADRKAALSAAVAMVATVVSFLAGTLSGAWWLLLGTPVGIVLMFVARAVKRRSQEAAELHAQYAALERYLKDFGRLDEKPPDAVVLWEHFLVYAVMFGIADEVAKAMAIKVPEVVQDPAFRTPYLLWWGVPGEGGGLSAFSEIHQSFGQAVSVATSSSSSGSGGGGGFSGGGGGGGGGGGFGAG